MSLANLPDWLHWWLISLLLLAWCGIALAVALVIAGAVNLRERAPRPARQATRDDAEPMAPLARAALDRIDREDALRRAIRERRVRVAAERSTLARVPAQRAPERGHRRVPCAPGRPCGLHHDAVCVAKRCCEPHCPTREERSS